MFYIAIAFAYFVLHISLNSFVSTEKHEEKNNHNVFYFTEGFKKVELEGTRKELEHTALEKNVTLYKRVEGVNIKF